MAHRAGLRQVKKSVRTKSGKTVQRSYWVKGAEAAKSAGGKVKGFLGRHKGKIAVGAALVGGAVLAHKYGHAAKGYLGAAHRSLSDTRALNKLKSEKFGTKGEGVMSQLRRAHDLGKVKGSLEHRSSGVPGAVRNAAQGLRKDVRKAVGEGRMAAQTTPGNSKLAAFREGALIAAQSFKTRRRQRAGK